MIERERAEFGCFSTQISREWHMGHAAKASVGLSSDPRSSSAPRRFQRFMIRGPFSTVLAPFARWGALRRAAGSLARFSKRLQYFFRSLATPRRLPLKRRAVCGLSHLHYQHRLQGLAANLRRISLARMLPFRPLAALFCSLSLVRSHSAFAIAALTRARASCLIGPIRSTLPTDYTAVLIEMNY